MGTQKITITISMATTKMNIIIALISINKVRQFGVSAG